VSRGEPLPIIILTASDDAIKSLDSRVGANDCDEAFRFEELLARVRSAIARPSLPRGKQEMVLRAGNLTLDTHPPSLGQGLPDRAVSPGVHPLETFVRHPGKS